MFKPMFKGTLALMTCLTLGGTFAQVAPSLSANAESVEISPRPSNPNGSQSSGGQIKTNTNTSSQENGQDSYFNKHKKSIKNFAHNHKGNTNKNKNTKPPKGKKAKKAKNVARNKDWFSDGLSKRQQKARNWVSRHESQNNWNILSYGGYAVGRFQLTSSYLGYVKSHGQGGYVHAHGKYIKWEKHTKPGTKIVNLDPQHQVQVADQYVKQRYGGWTGAERFWRVHHWY